MARGIGNRQKKVVTAKKVWVKRPPAPAGSKFQVPGSRKPVGRKP